MQLSLRLRLRLAWRQVTIWSTSLPGVFVSTSARWNGQLTQPGTVINRRLLAGGRVSLTLPGLPLDMSRAVCIESIRDVMI